MRRLLKRYLDWIDGCAFINVRRRDGRDTPYWHCFILPAAVVVGCYFAPLSNETAFVVLLVSAMLMFCWMTFVGIYYLRAKERYRAALGLPGWKEMVRRAWWDDSD